MRQPSSSSLTPQASQFSAKTALEIGRAVCHTPNQPCGQRRDTRRLCFAGCGCQCACDLGRCSTSSQSPELSAVKFCGPSPVLVARGVDSRRRAVTAPVRTQPQAIAVPHEEGYAIGGCRDSYNAGKPSRETRIVFRFRDNFQKEVIAQLQRTGDLRAVGHRRQNRARISLYQTSPATRRRAIGGRTRRACVAT